MVTEMTLIEQNFLQLAAERWYSPLARAIQHASNEFQQMISKVPLKLWNGFIGKIPKLK